MTKALYDRDNLTLTVSGHSGYAGKGSDIVCAGITAITIALVAALDEKGIEADVSTGDAEFLCTTTDKAALPYMDMAAAGINAISILYEDNVEIEYMTLRKDDD